MSSGVFEAREGIVPVTGGHVRFRVVGSGGGVPLLALHGGPGAGFDSLDPLESFAGDRSVVFYDQLGSGASDKPNDDSLWRIDRYVEEVIAVRQALDLDRIHLLGQRWGGMLAIEYMLSGPPGVVSLTLSSTTASSMQISREAWRLRSEMPQEVQDTLAGYEAAGDFQHPEYRSAMLKFYERHVCRILPWPDSQDRSFGNLAVDHGPYETMTGVNEFHVTGNLRDWDRIDRLGEIEVPTLVTFGRYGLGPESAETLHKGIPNAELHKFELSSHMAHLEEREAYLDVLKGFLERVESR